MFWISFWLHASVFADTDKVAGIAVRVLSTASGAISSTLAAATRGHGGGKWSGGWLPVAPSQMAAGTAPRLADNQRTSKLRQALKSISAQSRRWGGGQRAGQENNCGRQKSQQAWK